MTSPDAGHSAGQLETRGIVSKVINLGNGSHIYLADNNNNNSAKTSATLESSNNKGPAEVARRAINGPQQQLHPSSDHYNGNNNPYAPHSSRTKAP